MRTAVVISAVTLAAGGGAAAWLTYHHLGKSGTPLHRAANGVPISPSASTPSGQSSPSVSPTPSLAPSSSLPALRPTLSPTPIATTTGPGGSLVALAPAIPRDSQTSQVEAFVNAYFTAINAHSFQQFRVLLNPTLREHETAASFHAGYRTTSDSGATITSIAVVAPGLVGASITFVSHQQPSDSATGTACTDWNITLYLQDYSGRYLLGSPPGSYHPIYQAC